MATSANNNSNRGFAAMDADKQREIASKGGHASGGLNLEHVDKSAAGRKGAAAQPKEAKAEGGRNSHR
jgi:general stress protein YciG